MVIIAGWQNTSVLGKNMGRGWGELRKMFLSDQASVIWWHRRMAEYFSTW